MKMLRYLLMLSSMLVLATAPSACREDTAEEMEDVAEEAVDETMDAAEEAAEEAGHEMDEAADEIEYVAP